MEKEITDIEQEKYIEEGENAHGMVTRKNKPLTVEQALKLFKVDTEIWVVQRHVINSWDVTNAVGETFRNYQTKIWLIRNNIKFDFEFLKKEFVESIKELQPKKFPKIKYNFGRKTDNLLELNLFDLHLGQLCWSPESGDNYDIKIAEKRFIGNLENLVERAKKFGYEKIVFPIGNDFFNSDSLINATTKGTPQHEDARWQKTYKLGRKILIKAIEYLKQFAPVDVVVVPGNHDEQRMYYVGDCLECLYENDESVTIYNEEYPRKYYRFGDCLICYTHGNDVKANDLPLLMLQECKYSSECTFKEVHLGHLHHTKEIKYMSTFDSKGVIVRYMKSLTATDSWHSKMGYTCNIKGASAFVWNKKDGVIDMLESPVL